MRPAVAAAPAPNTGHPWWGTVRPVLVLLAVQQILWWWVVRTAELPAASFGAWTFLPDLALRTVWSASSGPDALAHVAVALAVAWTLLRRASAHGSAPGSLRWSHLDRSRLVRIVVMPVVGVLAWVYSTYDLNLYFDQPHLLERTTLLVFATLVLWRPIFVLPFAVLVCGIVGQFDHPIGHFSVAEQFVLVRILVLFGAMLLLRSWTSCSGTTEFAYLALTILASAYLACGLGKLTMDSGAHGFGNWATHGHVYFLTLATYANGWLAFLGPAEVSAFARGVSRVDPLLVAATLLLECGVFLAFLRRGLLVSFLIGWIAFHLGVFVVSGIFFWKWIVMEMALLVAFAKPDQAFPIFSRRLALLSVPLVVAGLFLHHPVTLAWYDSPVSYSYRFVATAADSSQFRLAPRFFSPYEYQFTMANFHYVSEHPDLGVVWGALWDRELVDRLLTVSTPSELLALESEVGRVFYDEDKARRLDHFLREFVENSNRRGAPPALLSLLAGPPQLWSFDRGGTRRPNEPILRIDIERVTSFYDGEIYREIDTRLCRSVLIAE